MKLSAIKDEIGYEPGPLSEAEPLLVLKFGSSVLKSLDDLPAIAGEIYRQRRKGNRIIAVVSALDGETDTLFDQAQGVANGASCSGIAELVSLGEERTAALLSIACDRIGLKASICRVEELGLYTSGSELDADFHELLPFALRNKLAHFGLVIVPGFVGIGKDGERTLLGRGGSDYTAAILGGKLGAKAVRLYKDVDGVFEDDPAIDPCARKYAQVSYDEALTHASKLVHAKALTFAAARGLSIEVEAIGSNTPTRIGGPNLFASGSLEPRALRIALAGYGVVGQALAKRLENDPRFEIAAILVRDVARMRHVPPPVPLTNDIERFAAVDADVLVEVLSCEATGAALSSTSLEEGIPLVTASKQVVAKHYTVLAAAALDGDTTLSRSATVGGGTPILESIARARAAGSIVQISAVLNGTVNFTLERLSQGKSLAEAIAEARERGFAEEDSEADLSGADAAAKLKIIAEAAFGIAPERLFVETDRLDEKRARQVLASGQRWVQLSEIRRGKECIRARVMFKPASAVPIVAVSEEWNTACIELEDGRLFSVLGRGAGGAATAEAVLADLYDLLEERARQREVGVTSADEKIEAEPSPSECRALA